MLNIQNKSDCCGCASCVQKCPHNCITMNPDEEGFWYPEIDKSKCSDCGICNQACFVGKQAKGEENYQIYSAKNKDEVIRYKSTSGGMFTPLAEAIIEQGGVVFGAAFDNEFNVSHCAAYTKEDLQQFRKSKYVQSNIGTTYIQTKQLLESGRKVLFSGLPCQIAGLKSFLEKEYDNLYCVDLICSSVSSPEVWKMYLAWLEVKMSAKITSISKREKEIDLSVLKPNQGNVTMKVLFDNGKELYQIAGAGEGQDAFLAGFLNKLYSRPSCHKCPSRGFTSGSDIMLGDFWGIEKVHPEFCDKYEDGTIIPFGVSEVILVTKKGESLFEAIKHNCECFEIDKDMFLSARNFGNWFQLHHSFTPHTQRASFFKMYSQAQFDNIDTLIRTELKKDTGLPIGVDIGKLKKIASEGTKIVCFGAGLIGSKTLRVFRSSDLEADYFCDNDKKLWGTKVDGVVVLSIDQLQNIYSNEKACVLITSIYRNEIKEQLESIGVSPYGWE